MEKPKTQADVRHEGFMEVAAGARLLAEKALLSIDSTLAELSPSRKPTPMPGQTVAMLQ